MYNRSRQASGEDLERICQLYNSFMFDSYLMKFGKPFVREYLKAILCSKYCISLIEGQGAGFIMATHEARRMRVELLFNGGVLYEWAKQALFHPVLALESLELLLYPSYACLKHVNAELLFIAVDPSCRSRGLAAGLIEDTLRAMRSKGIQRIKVSVHAGNAAVNGLLVKMGFQKRKDFRLFKRPSYLYDRELSSEGERCI